MGSIKDTADEVYRDFTMEGVASSKLREPPKAEIRALFALVDAIAFAAQAGLTTVADLAARDAFFAVAENQGKLVYVNNNNDADDDPANGVYEYVDDAPRIATGFYQGVTTVVQPLVDLSQAWAEGTGPAGPGSMSSKEWAENAAVQSSRINLDGHLDDPPALPSAPWEGPDADGGVIFRDALTNRELARITKQAYAVLRGLRLWAPPLDPDLPNSGAPAALAIRSLTDGRPALVVEGDGQLWAGKFTPDTIARIAAEVGSAAVEWRGDAGPIDLRGTNDLWRGVVTDERGWTGEAVQLPNGAFDTAVVASPTAMWGYHFYGQSNAGAGGDNEPALITPLFDHHVLQLGSGTIGQARYGSAGATDPETIDDLTPARHYAGTPSWPAVSTGFAAEMLARRRGEASGGYLTRTDWWGAQPAGTFVKGQVTYDNLMVSIAAGFEQVARYGRAYSPTIVYVQGENGPTDREEFADTVASIIDDTRADVLAAHNVTPAFLFFQINTADTATSGAFATPMKLGAVDLARQYLGTDVALIGPMYQFPISDDIHGSELARNMEGELTALVDRAVRRTGSFTPLMPRAVSRAGAVITIDFCNPGLPIAWDTDWVLAAVDYGFTYSDDSGDPPAIIGVAITGDAQVEVTLEGVPAGGNQVIRYAIDAQDGGAGIDDGWSTARGQLYASSGEASPWAEYGYACPADIRHYAICFEEPVA